MKFHKVLQIHRVDASARAMQCNDFWGYCYFAVFFGGKKKF